MKPATKRWIFLGFRLVVIAAVTVGLVLFIRHMDFSALGAAISHARVLPLICGTILGFTLLGWKAVFWKVMLAPRAQIAARRMWRYNIIAFATSLVTPARAGELLRLWLLKRRDGVPTTHATAVALAEKLCDTMSLLLLSLPVALFAHGIAPWMMRSLAILLGVAVAVIVVAFVLMRVVHPDGLLGRLAAGMAVLREPRGFFLAFGANLAAWVTDAINIWLVLTAVGVSVPWFGPLLILFVVNLAILVPSTPGHVGALELGAVVATDLLGIPHADGLAFALLYHSIQVIPLLIAGLLNLRLALSLRAEMQRDPGQAEIEPADGAAKEPA